MSPDLSIIILSYNVKELLLNCLESVYRNADINWQVIVVDNASLDDSVEEVRKHFPQVELIKNKENLGFAAGNNIGVKYAKAPIILFLNPDTVIVGNAIGKTLEVLLSNPDYGAITCKVELPDGKLDYSCHRGFPTPWNSLMYFTGFAKLFPRSSFFSGYSATYLDVNKPHEIDSATGAFLMVRKIAGDQIGWWDKDYFWNGEDIEFCFSLKEKARLQDGQGWKIYFYPDEKIIHFKGSSSKQEKRRTISHGVSAMRIFYKKHYYKKYPPLLRDFILWGIKLLEYRRKLWI